MGDEDRMVKMEVDYSDTVDKVIPECETLAADKKLNEAIDKLLVVEKQTRGAGDAISSSKVLVCIVALCYKVQDWTLLKEHITSLCKKRGHFKLAVTKMVQRCCEMVPEIEDKERKMDLIEVLRTVTEGKIYVENERARVTRTLAAIYEKDDEPEKAAKVLQELQVETFGTMEKKEKVEFILEQMRLCFETKDYIRTQIISKKISIKYFEGADTEELKLRYYRQMIDLNLHHKEYLAVSKNYHEIYNTTSVKEEEQKWKQALQRVVLYLILAEYNNEQSDMLARIKTDTNLAKLPYYQNVLMCFDTAELLNWSILKKVYSQHLKSETGEPASPLDKEENWDVLQMRVVEHNIRVLAKYYTRISMQHFADLLHLDSKEAEKRLCEQVVKDTVTAKIDRLDGIISFTKQKDTEQILNAWSGNLNSVMDLIGNVNHLITKERMVHQVS
ncbi:26S proteasome non-ATPase regulatory subunit 12-like [Bolinopsis microptera]|uniref:26S proteasome non-ATPase regulatory subunit 12-like n=1 Tax=Bolinopsis microptera TaxID=2820187 RepID=UPI0030795EE0